MRHFRLLTIATLSASLLLGCATRGPGDPNDNTCDPTAPECGEGLTCSTVVDGTFRCFGVVTIRGVVLDATTDAPIAGALVQAVDVNGAAVGSSGETVENGAFTLTVPAGRSEEGAPVDGSYTLRAQAATYQAFPTAIRPALPLDASTATSEETGWVIENPLTTVKLLPLPGDTSQLGSISGTITAERNAGILVVAETGGVGATGFSNANGAYTIFNVSAGNYTVQGYAAGIQIVPTATTVEAAEDKIDVDLIESADPLSTVSGSVQIVNAPGGAMTSVVLALESTFVESAARGTVPPGLRVGEITSGFTLEQVPNGRYVVLAAFENDDLVRDPDQTIGGTSIVRIEVPDPVSGNIIDLPEGFKVTEALVVVSPGSDGPEEMFEPNPIFTWNDDSSEDGYDIRVFDSFGNEIWTDEIGSVSGSATVSHTYGGPALEPGMFYQFKATSFRDKNGIRTAISTTEDLKGVFQFVVVP